MLTCYLIQVYLLKRWIYDRCFFKKLQKETCKPPPPMLYVKFPNCRSSHSKVFLGKDVLKICSKFTVNHPCRSAISINLLCNFIEITLRHGCSPVNLLHILRKSFLKNTSEWLLLKLLRTAIEQTRWAASVLSLS